MQRLLMYGESLISYQRVRGGMVIKNLHTQTRFFPLTQHTVKKGTPALLNRLRAKKFNDASTCIRLETTKGHAECGHREFFEWKFLSKI